MIILPLSGDHPFPEEGLPHYSVLLWSSPSSQTLPTTYVIPIKWNVEETPHNNLLSRWLK